MDIIEKLLALESEESLPNRENYRTEVQNYQSYLIPFLNRNSSEQIFTISGLYDLESVPIFLSEAAYLSFQDDYLRKHGYLDTNENQQNLLTIKKLTGRELFETLAESSLKSFFVLPSDTGELLFSFNLVEVFTDCFYHTQSNLDWEMFSDESLTKTVTSEADAKAGAINNEEEIVSRQLEKYQKFRQLFENDEWMVLISQPTKNKLLKGEVTRDDFDLDRHDDKRIVIFSDAEVYDDYRKAAEQHQVKLYVIKVNSQRIFGSDLSPYNAIWINSNSPGMIKIDKEDFKLLNELFAAFEIESKLFQIADFTKGKRDYQPQDYIDIKEFQNYILPLDKIEADETAGVGSLPVHLIEDSEGNPLFPVFTAKDCFEAFRQHETSNSSNENLIEPHFIGGRELFQILNTMKTPKIIFNSRAPAKSITFEPSFALMAYCA